MANVCSKCSTDNADGALVCRHCGASLGRQAGWSRSLIPDEDNFDPLSAPTLVMRHTVPSELPPLDSILIAPEPQHAGVLAKAAQAETERRFDQTGRNIVVGLVSLGWLWAFWTLGSFMVDSLLHPETSKAGPFTLTMGPLIVAATVLGPALGAVWLIWFRKPRADAAPGPQLPRWLQSTSDGLFGSVIEPMIDLIERLKDWEGMETRSGYLAGFAWLRATLVDLATMRVVGEQRIQGSRIVLQATGDGSLDPWGALTADDKLAMLEGIVADELARVLPELLGR